MGAEPAQDRRPARRPGRGLLPARDRPAAGLDRRRRRSRRRDRRLRQRPARRRHAAPCCRTTRGSSTRPRCRSTTTPTPSSRSRWLAFLDELWPDDADSIAALQEFFGYVISGRLDLHKILLLVGPTRGGKGAIARVLGQLVGPEQRRRPDPVQPRQRLRAGAAARQAAGRHLRRPPRRAATRPPSSSGCWRSPARTRSPSTASTATSGPASCRRRFMRDLQRAAPLRRRRRRDRRPLRRAAADPLLARRRGPRPRATTSARAGARSSTGRSTASTGCASKGRFTNPPASDEAVIALTDLASPVAAFVRDRCVRDLGAEVRAASCSRRGSVGRGQRPQAGDRAALRPRPAGGASRRCCAGTGSPPRRQPRAVLRATAVLDSESG